MSTQTSKNKVTKLNVMLIALNKFVIKYVQHALPFYIILRKESQFELTPKCEKDGVLLKAMLYTPLYLLKNYVRYTSNTYSIDP